MTRAHPEGAWFWFYLQTPLLSELRGRPDFDALVQNAAARRGVN